MIGQLAMLLLVGYGFYLMRRSDTVRFCLDEFRRDD